MGAKQSADAPEPTPRRLDASSVRHPASVKSLGSSRSAQRAAVVRQQGAAAPAGFTYHGFGPEMDGTTKACFDDGLLFRIVNGDVWGFYNDSYQFEMHIVVVFGPDSDLLPLGHAIADKREDHWFRFRLVVYPGETKTLCKGAYRGFKARFTAKALSTAYRERLVGACGKEVGAEYDRVVQIAHGCTVVDTILARCVAQGVPFVDLQFPPCEASLVDRKHDGDNFVTLAAWLRPDRLARAQDAGKPELFKDDVSPTDIAQGQLGDSWFLGAVATLADHPRRIRELFVQYGTDPMQVERERAVGAYRVLLSKNGWWTVVTTDDYLPSIGSVPCFARNKQDPTELWVSVIEKAFAKLHGAYSSISAGDALFALSDLTGAVTYRFDEKWCADFVPAGESAGDLAAQPTGAAESFDDYCAFKTPRSAAEEDAMFPSFNQASSQPGSPWGSSAPGGDSARSAGRGRNLDMFRDLEGYLREGFLVLLNTPTGSSARAFELHGEVGVVGLERRYAESGLGLSQTYAVLEAKAFPECDVFLLKIRNPWSDGVEWTGDWSDASDLWTKMPDVAAACGHIAAEEEDDGTFWMEWSDTLKFFDGGGVCFCQPAAPQPCIDYRVKGRFERGFASVALEVLVEQDCTVFLSLSQHDERLREHAVEEIIPGGAVRRKTAFGGGPSAAGDLTSVLSEGNLAREPSSQRFSVAFAPGNVPGGADPQTGYLPTLLAVCAPHSREERLRVDLTSTLDPSRPTREHSFLQSRDCGLRYTFRRHSRPYYVIPRVHESLGELRDYVIGLRSCVPIGKGTLSVRFVRIDSDCNVHKNYGTFRLPDGHIVPCDATCQMQEPGFGPVTEIRPDMPQPSPLSSRQPSPAESAI